MSDSNSEYIRSWLDAENWQRFPENLYAPIGYTLEAGGKHLRPTLLLMSNALLGGNVNASVRGAAMAVELFHNFTLLHDDVMDRAPMRRGRPTVYKRWNDNTAILSGDQMMIEAYRRLEQVEPQYLPEVLRLFGQMATGVCEGQQLDMDMETMRLTELNRRNAIDDYITMIERKTAYLIAYSLRLGAVLAGAEKSDSQALYDFGIALGLAFQLQDDMLDVYGDPKTFGKQIGGDIAEGKKTFLTLCAYQNANPEQKALLVSTLEDSTLSRQDKYDRVRQLYDSLHVRQMTEEKIQYYTDSALKALDSVNADDELKQPLRQLAARMSERQY